MLCNSNSETRTKADIHLFEGGLFDVACQAIARSRSLEKLHETGLTDKERRREMERQRDHAHTHSPLDVRLVSQVRVEVCDVDHGDL